MILKNMNDTWHLMHCDTHPWLEEAGPKMKLNNNNKKHSSIMNTQTNWNPGKLFYSLRERLRVSWVGKNVNT